MRIRHTRSLKVPGVAVAIGAEGGRMNTRVTCCCCPVLHKAVKVAKQVPPV
jgi:hypothetical protein